MALTVAAQIQQFYNAYFGRPADPAGLAFWEAGATASGNLIDSAIKLFGDPATPEFARMYPPGTSIETFLDTAYDNMFNRAPDAEGRLFWANAFRTWVADGTYSEGEARAQILMNVLRAADAQTDTNDKLSLTNKQFVADAATSSVKQFGTQSDYEASLDAARILLGAVDHTLASVNTALGMIQNGEVVLPGRASGEAINLITSFASAIDQSIELGWGPDADNHFTTFGRDVVKFSTASQAPFAYIAYDFGDSSYYLTAGRPVVYVEPQRDRIDLSVFNLRTQESGNIAIVNDTLNGKFSTSGPPAAYRVHDGFFQGKALAMFEDTGINNRPTTEVFVDINGNGNLDPQTDMWLSIALPIAQVNESLFIL
ncbi:DUF4214 domain-containing protein [Pigmentiphaga aceris]|uniref:DUF4214 domain-containing protein n=1 Tax=Pigmentiphaga aceris TaxID=1940612 RepID=A0A5C0AYM2_9BURK|nr:DUF4214 domain-containing protein [Pigmentiphaga aceris]QEI07519.1 DUF4214 domain-containing protein [Pigmentiphaga aceris]